MGVGGVVGVGGVGGVGGVDAGLQCHNIIIRRDRAWWWCGWWWRPLPAVWCLPDPDAALRKSWDRGAPSQVQTSHEQQFTVVTTRSINSEMKSKMRNL